MLKSEIIQAHWDEIATEMCRSYEESVFDYGAPYNVYVWSDGEVVSCRGLAPEQNEAEDGRTLYHVAKIKGSRFDPWRKVPPEKVPQGEDEQIAMARKIVHRFCADYRRDVNWTLSRLIDDVKIAEKYGEHNVDMGEFDVKCMSYKAKQYSYMFKVIRLDGYIDGRPQYIVIDDAGVEHIGLTYAQVERMLEKYTDKREE